MSEFRIFSIGFIVGFSILAALLPFAPDRQPIEAAAYVLPLAVFLGFVFVILFGKSR